jgi:hypothetical protein
MNESEDSLQLGIAAYKAGDKEKARSYLLKAVREHPDSEQAWGWLSNTAANEEERIHCLRQVLRIHPENTSAKERLRELERNEWLNAAPTISAPTKVAAAVVAPDPVGPSSATARPVVGSDTVQIILVVLLVVTVLFWLGVGLLQLLYSVDPFDFNLLCVGGLNLLFSIVNGFLIVPVARRTKSALQWLYGLAAIGSAFGMFQLLIQGAYLQVCAVPLYILMLILTYLNREVFVN